MKPCAVTSISNLTLWLLVKKVSISRKNEAPGRSFFRSERFSFDSGKWFFSTREGTLEGPFDSQGVAEERLKTYLSIQSYHLMDSEEARGLGVVESS